MALQESVSDQDVETNGQREVAIGGHSLERNTSEGTHMRVQPGMQCILRCVRLNMLHCPTWNNCSLQYKSTEK